MAVIDPNWSDTLRVGKQGEKFVKEFCNKNNIQHSTTSFDENRESGVDCKILGVPTDIKTTCKIFLAKYMLNYDKFHVRHPFRKETKAINYCILDEKEKEFSIRYMGNIDDYLIKYYFKSLYSLNKVKEYINGFEKKSFKQCKFLSEDQMFGQIKQRIMLHIKPKIYCTYTSIGQSMDKENGELNIALLTYKDHQELIRSGKPIF